ncbi:DUF2798 domain-containing protein [Streptococcus cristatus]|nr:DUF2798 domain-containing protein [Streptococcus cristatus]
MPRDFKDAMFFTLLMCSLMVLGMSIWNLYLLGRLSLGNLAAGLLPGFTTAFLLDVLLVGPLVKGLAFRFLKDYYKCWQKIAVISGGMVLMMLSLMSIYGLLFNGMALSMESYLGAWGTNFVMPFPLNFLLVGPFSRFILGNIQKPFLCEEKLEDFEDDDELPTII